MLGNSSRLFRAGLTNWDSEDVTMTPIIRRVFGYCMSQKCSPTGKKVYRTSNKDLNDCPSCGSALVWRGEREK